MPTPAAFPPELGVYIDKLFGGDPVSPYQVIMGNASKENSLVQWCVEEGVTYVILYDLNNWRSGSTYTTLGKTLISNLIAKFSAVGIKVGASHSGSAATVNAVNDFNLGQIASKRFRHYVFEDEFWQFNVNSAARAAAVSNFTANMDNANTVLNPNGVTIDIYLGHPTAAEITQIGLRAPRLFLHDYRLWAEYSYVKQKVRDLSDNFPGGYTILPIASAENAEFNGEDDPALNYSGYKWEGKNSLGVVVSSPLTILDWWRAFCFNPPGSTGTPNSFQTETYGQVQTRITVGGMIIFTQSLIRALNYQHRVVPVCGLTSGISTTNITNTSAKLNWSAATNATSYSIRYRIVGTTTWATVSTAALTITISGLTSGANYEYQIQTLCAGGNTSAFSSSTTFTTLAATCAMPGGLSVTLLTTTTARLNWLPVTGEIDFNVRYREIGAGSWTTVAATASTDHLDITGLTDATDHEFQVQTDCGGGSLSTFTTSFLFTTLGIACSIPASFAVAGVGLNTAFITWLPAGSAVGYNLRYREVGSSTWITSTEPNEWLSLSPLNPATDYEVQIQTDCGGSTSAFSSSLTFTTSAVPVPPIVNPAGNLSICPGGGSIILRSSEPMGNTWNTGETTNQITVTNPGVYYTSVNGLQSNQVIVQLASQVIPSVSINGPTSPIINGSVLTFVSSAVNALPNSTYRWEINGVDIGITTEDLTRSFNNGDSVQVFITNPSVCGNIEQGSNLLVISYPSAPNKPTITADGTCIPTNGFVKLTSSWPNGNLWSNGEMTRDIYVYTSGVYSVKALNEFGVESEASDGVDLSLCSLTVVPPMSRVGDDAGYGAAENYPEYLEGVALNVENPYGTPGTRLVNYGDSLSSLNRSKLNYIGTDNDTYHLVGYEDTLWEISYKYYGRHDLAWVIQDVNNLENAFELTVNTTLLIPDLLKLKIQLEE